MVEETNKEPLASIWKGKAELREGEDEQVLRSQEALRDN
jgi:Asp-tRNA(Asn)/Glu-tRNA(Gln) amidotransferase C subunit